MKVDVTANRRLRSWSRHAQIGRVLWALCYLLFRFSPRPFWAWRVWILRCFGAQIGRHVHVHPTVRIMIPWHLKIDDDAAIGDCACLYALGAIHIGARATISQNAHLCGGTHDWHDRTRPLIKAPITIGADAWICADAFVGPNVRIGTGAIVGARSVAMKNLPDRHLGIGNPMQTKVIP